MLLSINPEETLASGVHHGRSPHLDMAVDVLAPIDPELLSGTIGETMRWIGSSQTALSGADSDYEVSSILAHDFKTSTFHAKTRGRSLKTISHVVGLSAATQF